MCVCVGGSRLDHGPLSVKATPCWGSFPVLVALMHTVKYIILMTVSWPADLLDLSLRKSRFFNRNPKFFSFTQ